MSTSIPSPPSNGLHLGPLFVHAYGLAYVVAILAAVLIASRRWERAGGDRHLVQEVALWGVPGGLIGGRLYFLATSWNEVPPHWWGPFAIWDGGLGIWGGIAAGTLAGTLVLRRRGVDIPRFLDAAAPALLVAQAIGRGWTDLPTTMIEEAETIGECSCRGHTHPVVRLLLQEPKSAEGRALLSLLHGAPTTASRWEEFVPPVPGFPTVVFIIPPHVLNPIVISGTRPRRQ